MDAMRFMLGLEETKIVDIKTAIDLMRQGLKMTHESYNEYQSLKIINTSNDSQNKRGSNMEDLADYFVDEKGNKTFYWDFVNKNKLKEGWKLF